MKSWCTDAKLGVLSRVFSKELDSHAWRFFCTGPWCAKDVHNPKSAANGFVSDEQPMAVNCESQAHPVWELNGVLAQPSSSVQESPDYVKGDMDIQEATIEDSSQMILDVANERTKVVSTSYRLQGIVQHLGGQASGGHFIADIHDAKANRWFRCDDSIVRDVSSRSVMYFLILLFVSLCKSIIIRATSRLDMIEFMCSK